MPAGAAPWAVDMARYEAAVMHGHVALDPSDDAPVGSSTWRSRPRSARPALPAGVVVGAPGEPTAGEWALLVHRRRPTRWRRSTLTPIAADIYERFARGDRSVTACAEEVMVRGAGADAVFVESFAGLWAT